MEATEVIVNTALAGSRLDLYLAQQFASQGLTRTEAQRLIFEGQITINGRPAKASTRLKPRDRVQLRTLPMRDSLVMPENLPLDILYEDRHCLVLNKPAGLLVHPAARKMTGTLVNALLYHCPDLDGIGGERRPGVVHRLDKETSGSMVVAKTNRAFQRLARQFKERKVEKEYIGLVWGKLPEAAGVIDRPIGRHRSDRKRMSSRYTLAKRRQAVTEWQVEKLFKLRADSSSAIWVSLLRMKPKTGRTHQLRVHLADLGFPIIGDKLYGHKRHGHERRSTTGSLLAAFPRQALHAEKLGFIHPITQQSMVFRASLPNDMRQLLNFLAEHSA
jgi:23S rRNA pseudouridine1911/1915/1917 synthase